MELRVLRYFLAVAEKGSVTGAAKVLHVTQPTLSRQLMDLEEELGQKLLVRSNHSVRLTSRHSFEKAVRSLISAYIYLSLCGARCIQTS